ncbi:hypothetical protein N0V93_008511 [Gnomoniopsis smithogilvyi]|uniref:Uncharacterized protein n=1 Tax=Gnomoniopsis smithogilvyi TaxID=1191159 RepID=A0A9W8YPB3_9PEZI|nr:hypothetical protein N0V93_008511 [Gnomoniopsis smithogilvyi]
MDSFPSSLSYVSFVIGIFSFTLTILNLLALYANFLSTLRNAPEEIRDILGNLREQILEEREALRQQTRELRNKKAQIQESRRSRHPAHAGRPRSSSRGGLHSSYSNGNLKGNYGTALTHCEHTLSLHYLTIRDLWRKFKAFERPFLVSDGARAEAIHRGGTWVEDDLVKEKELREDIEMHGEAGSTANYTYLYKCDMIRRFIWWQSKSDVVKLADSVQRVMLRRMEREVTNSRMMLKQIRDGGDGPEDINNPRFDSGPGPGRGSRGNTPLGLRRRPLGESCTVYESSDSSDSTAGAKLKARLNERDARVNVSEVGQRQSPTRRGPPPRGDGYDPRYAGDVRRQGNFPRGPPPIIIDLPRASRPRTRHGYEGPLSPQDFKRG